CRELRRRSTFMNQTTSNPAVTADIRALVEAVVQAARPLRVILFGSRARGTAGPDSDTDLLIVQAEPDAIHRSRWRELQRIHGAVVPEEFSGLTTLTDFGVAFRYEAYDETEEPFDRVEITAAVERLVQQVENLLPPPNPHPPGRNPQ